jgi:nucleobase:cation symporter-1, NCS1 family
VRIILGAVIGPKYVYMKNTLPASANVDTCSLVSFFIFLAIFCPILLIPPEKLQLPLKVCSQIDPSLGPHYSLLIRLHLS